MRLYSKLLGLTLVLGIAAASAQTLGPPGGGGGGAPSGPAGGGLSGTYPNPTVATNANLTGDVTSVGNATTYNNVIPATKGGVGAATGALKGNGSGVAPTQAACADLSNGGTACAQAYTASTWTPTLTTTGTVGTPAYSIQVGSYEQIGRLVVAHFSIGLSGWTGTPTGNLRISLVGLPAPTSTVNDYGTCFVGQFGISPGSVAAFGIGAYIAPATTVAELQLNAQTASNAISTAVSGLTPQFLGTCLYHT